MLEHPYIGAAQSCTNTDRSVIKLVRDEEAAFGDECGYNCRVGRKAHRRDDRIFLSNETGNEGFCDQMQFRGATFNPGATGGETVTMKALLNGVCTSTLSLSKAKVIVGRNVEGPGRGSGEIKSVVVVLRLAIEECNCPTRNASDR
jgi:hypothetical protein